MQSRMSRPSWLLALVTLGVVVAAACGGWLWYVRYHDVLLSPFMIDRDGTPPLSSLNKPKYVVYGFAPYWNLSKTVVQPEITHLAYFSLPITQDGDLDGISNDQASNDESDISARRWRSQLLDSVVNDLKPNQRLTVTLTQFDKAGIETFLSSPSAQVKFQDSLRTFLRTTTRPVAGINVDIEYAGDASLELRTNYVSFIQKTRQTMDEYAQSAKKEKLELSLSVFASAASHQLIWDLPALTPYVDHVVVMAYDFHRTSSPVAGPVAPMFGAKTNWDNDIALHIKEFLEKMPAEKILLGVPFYGYEWETTNGDARSLVYPGTGSTASYSRVQKLLASNSAEVADGPITQGWDEEALSPYVIFNKDNRQHVIYYEDARSIGYKLELVNELRLGGVAIWALGYEDGSRDLWDAIHTQLN